jgi:hypothetical protein
MIIFITPTPSTPFTCILFLFSTPFIQRMISLEINKQQNKTKPSDIQLRRLDVRGKKKNDIKLNIFKFYQLVTLKA